MSSLSSTRVKQSLLKKGFRKAEGDHHYYLYYYEGKVATRTKMSHNDQDIDDYLISKMSKQCGIKKPEFMNLVNCPLDEAGYVSLLKENALI